MQKISRLILSLFAFIALGMIVVALGEPVPQGRSPSDGGINLTGNISDTTIAGPFLSGPFTPTLSLPVRDLPIHPIEPVIDRELHRRLQLFDNLSPFNIDSNWQDPLVQTSPGGGTTDPPLLSFDGLDRAAGGGAAPSDVNGYIGKDHYIQMINASVFNIYNKNGVLLTGPVELNDLWSSSAGGCNISNSGDPIVVYDHLADRWVMGQFFNSGNGFCIAISQTGDPTGSYYGYAVSTPTFPDYFKLGVWTDAYYVGANQGGNNLRALDRDAMLAGDPLNVQAFAVSSAGPHSLMLPGDLDGPAPPPGTNNHFFRHIDGAFGGGSDRVELFEIDIDWDTPANSSVTGPTQLAVASYSLLCNISFSCIRQPDTNQRIDSVTEWPMYRMQYRYFGTHETLLVNHAVLIGPANEAQAGIRWYELRKSGGTWSVYQQSTLAPDSDSRWMGSIAMDKDGNIGLGYNVSSSSTYPSVRFAVREAGDPLHTLRTEASMVVGNGSQTGTNRWSDYTSMTVDPVDDCTFWFTAEYYQTTASVGWDTRIGKFTVAECAEGPPEVDLSLDKSAPSQVTIGMPLTFTLTITNSGPATATNVMITDTLPAGVTLADVIGATGCAQNGNDVVCSLNDLPALQSAEVQVVVTPTISGILTNTAYVSAAETESNPGDEMDTAQVTIKSYGVALSPSQSAEGRPGSTLVYTVTVTNAGQVSDTYQLSILNADWPSILSTSSVSLAPSASQQITLSVTIPFSASNQSSDAITLRAVSQTDAEVFANTKITSTSVWWPVHLPLLIH